MPTRGPSSLGCLGQRWFTGQEGSKWSPKHDEPWPVDRLIAQIRAWLWVWGLGIWRPHYQSFPRSFGVQVLLIWCVYITRLWEGDHLAQNRTARWQRDCFLRVHSLDRAPRDVLAHPCCWLMVLQEQEKNTKCSHWNKREQYSSSALYWLSVTLCSLERMNICFRTPVHDVEQLLNSESGLRSNKMITATGQSNQ